MFEKQLLHVIGLSMLLGILILLSRINGFLSGNLWKISTGTWFILLVTGTVIHQVYVWFCWRAELYLGLLSHWFGKHAFKLYAYLFFLLVVLRPILITCLAISNRNTIPLPGVVRFALSILLIIPPLYLVYSMKRYFGYRRAVGIDHFDLSFRNMPLVKEGIFRFTNNGMYVYGFMVLWIPGIYFASMAALAAALFSHIYIWIHYDTTELPDMKRIYEEA